MPLLVPRPVPCHSDVVDAPPSLRGVGVRPLQAQQVPLLWVGLSGAETQATGVGGLHPPNSRLPDGTGPVVPG